MERRLVNWRLALGDFNSVKIIIFGTFWAFIHVKGDTEDEVHLP